jgi:type I restriction enzyme S subunit
MNKIANAGSVYLMPDLHCPVSLAMNLFLIRVDKNRANQKYVYHYLRANESYIKQFASGTAATTITKESVRNLNVTLPPLSVQRKIAAVLSAWDDMIENNLRRIKILEEMTQNIYQEWFVKFCYPNKEQVEMIASKVGTIPDGWEVVNLADIVEFIRGVEPGSSKYMDFPKEGYIPFLRVGDLGDRKSNIFVPYSSVNNKIFNKTDIALSLDGTIGIVRLGLVGAYSTGIRKVAIKNTTKISWTYLYCLLRSDYIQEIIKSNAKGTTIIHAGSATEKMVIGLPPMALLECFESKTAPMLKLVLNLVDKVTKLHQTRDLLLSKLISGEIDVSDLDIKVEEDV